MTDILDPTPTPTPETPAPTVDAPAADPTPAPALGVDRGDGRDVAGKFATKAEADAAAAKAAVVEKVAADPAAPLTPAEREIIGRLNGAEYKLKVPVGFELPWKREKETGFAKFEDIERSPFFERDYRVKTERLSQREREFEERRVEFEAREEIARTNRERLYAAAEQGGEALERERRHQQLMETDPEYRRRVERAEELDVREKVDAYREEQDFKAEIASITQRSDAYILRAAKEAGVDPKRVRQIYSQNLVAGQYGERVHADDVDAIIAEEVRVRQEARRPVDDEVARLRAENAALKAQQDADAQNGKVTAAIHRSATPRPGSTAARGAPTTSPTFKPFDPDTETEAEFQKRWQAHRRSA